MEFCFVWVSVLDNMDRINFVYSIFILQTRKQHIFCGIASWIVLLAYWIDAVTHASVKKQFALSTSITAICKYTPCLLLRSDAVFCIRRKFVLELVVKLSIDDLWSYIIWGLSKCIQYLAPKGIAIGLNNFLVWITYDRELWPHHPYEN